MLKCQLESLTKAPPMVSGVLGTNHQCMFHRELCVTQVTPGCRVLGSTHQVTMGHMSMANAETTENDLGMPIKARREEPSSCGFSYRTEVDGRRKFCQAARSVVQIKD